MRATARAPRRRCMRRAMRCWSTRRASRSPPSSPKCSLSSTAPAADAFLIAAMPLVPPALRALAHIVLEAIAYFVGFRLYLRSRRQSGDALPDSTRWTVIAAAAVGAVVGSKLLYWAEDPAATAANWLNPDYLLGGKTIVGGLVGGLVAVELAKRVVGERRSSGDLFALPLCVGIAVGRLGCLIAGPGDHTWGAPTTLAIGVDGGDGIPRHCLPLYEIAWLLLLAVVLWRWRDRLSRSGDLFRLFMIGYLAFPPGRRDAEGRPVVGWADGDSMGVRCHARAPCPRSPEAGRRDASAADPAPRERSKRRVPAMTDRVRPYWFYDTAVSICAQPASGAWTPRLCFRTAASTCSSAARSMAPSAC